MIAPISCIFTLATLPPPKSWWELTSLVAYRVGTARRTISHQCLGGGCVAKVRTRGSGAAPEAIEGLQRRDRALYGETLGLVIRLTHIPRDTDDLFTRSHGRTPAEGASKSQKESNPLHRPIGSATDRDSCVLGDPRAPPGMGRLEPVPARGMSPGGRRQRGLGFPSSAAPNRSRALRTRLSGVGCDH